ncbi:jg3834 [Pararge aegeria aegeria]|uniref:Jg3834 protein n=1 Tax=Pararge aegeria aegeria TaxID=348720 RepID=A0A8S4RZ44_9NEOP|nr:jg3834 [Pararge aegeria aegeria]
MAKTEKSFPRNFTGCLTCVQVLNIMVLLGFMLNYALRVNLTIAIVEMIYDTKNHTVANFTEHINGTVEHPGHIEQTRYHWDTKQKNLLLGCFFWGYVLTELPGGRLAEIIGARRVFGYSTLLASILTLLSPWAAAAGFGWIVALRVVLGFLLGATWPAILPMASKWIPPMDRSKFMSNMMVYFIHIVIVRTEHFATVSRGNMAAEARAGVVADVTAMPALDWSAQHDRAD